MTQIPAAFTWPNGAKLAVSIILNVEEGAEQNIRDGDKGPEPVDELGAVPSRPMRVYGNESNYQYGIKAGWPRILKLFDDYALTPTVTAAALALTEAGLAWPGIDRLEIHHDVDNPASGQVAAKAGFQELGPVAAEKKAPRDSGTHLVWVCRRPHRT